MALLLGCGVQRHSLEPASAPTGEQPADRRSAPLDNELPSHPLRVTFIDVGQGDAILIQSGALDILIDAGAPGAWNKTLRTALDGITGPLEALIITHPHDDHFYDARYVLTELEVLRVFTNGEQRGPPRDAKAKAHWDEFTGAVAKTAIALEHWAVGDTWEPVEGLVLRVLATGSPDGGEFPDTPDGADINNDSLVLMLEYGGRRILLTGDIETKGQALLVKRYCPEKGACSELIADVFKVPHHGSEHYDQAFYEAVAPTVAVISADFKRGLPHCLPRASVVDLLLKMGARVLSTSCEGVEDVAVVIQPNGAWAWTAPTGPVFGWDRAGKQCAPRFINGSGR